MKTRKTGSCYRLFAGRSTNFSGGQVSKSIEFQPVFSRPALQAWSGLVRSLVFTATLFTLASPLSVSAVQWELQTTSIPSSGNNRDLGLKAGTVPATMSNTGSVTLESANTYPDSWSMYSSNTLGAINRAAIAWDQRAGASVMPATAGDDESGPSPATARLTMSSLLVGSVLSHTAGSQNVFMQNHDYDGPGYANVEVTQTFRIVAGAGETVGSPVLVNLNALYSMGILAGQSSQITGGGELSNFRVSHDGNEILSHSRQSSVGDAWGAQLQNINAHIGDTFEVASSVYAWLNVINQNFVFAVGTRSASSSFSPSLDVTFTVTTAPVPEPETWAMLMAGMALVGWRSGRRNHEKVARPSSRR